MKKKPVTQNFEMTLGVFFTQMMAKLGFMKRDKTEFVKQGVTDKNITDAEAMLTEYSDIPTGDELLGMQMTTTEEKNTAAGILHTSISEVIGRAAIKYNVNSGNYRQFGISSLSEIDGGELATAARRVFRAGTKMATDLATEGLTPAMLATLKTNTEVYDGKLANQEDAIANREIAAEERIEKANAIYAIMVKYCEKGKHIWVSTNQAKYNDYVIYDTPPSNPGTPPPPKA